MIQRVALIERFRTPNKAYARPYRATHVKPRWHTVYKSGKGNYIVLRGNRVYETEWRYA